MDGRRNQGGEVKAAAAVFAVVAALCLTACGSSASGSESDAPPSHTLNAHTAATGLGSLQSLRIVSGGHLRTYLLYVPASDSAKNRLPLVLAYHGAGDTATGTSTETNLLKTAEQQQDMIVAFMQGYDDTWNEVAGHTPAHQAGINDVAYTAAVLRRIETYYDVDLTRVAATGVSNGALLVDLLGCRLAANLTLIAPIEGELPVSISPGCRPAMPISVYEVHGTSDGQIPYGGGPFPGVGGGTTVLSAPAAVARWSKLDHCTSKAPRSQSGADVFTNFVGCKLGVTVTLDTVLGGQHVWPPDLAGDLLGVFSKMTGKRRAVRPS
jgi:polyhydroxybutyrate depolymerase